MLKTNYSQLADDLQRLCCAKTESKFFDLVTDSIQQISEGLRFAASLQEKIFEVQPLLALPTREEMADRILADPQVIWLRECGFHSAARFESELRGAIIRASAITAKDSS